MLFSCSRATLWETVWESLRCLLATRRKATDTNAAIPTINIALDTGEIRCRRAMLFSSGSSARPGHWGVGAAPTFALQ
jgi:hypothetical protein